MITLKCHCGATEQGPDDTSSVSFDVDDATKTGLPKERAIIYNLGPLRGWSYYLDSTALCPAHTPTAARIVMS